MSRKIQAPRFVHFVEHVLGVRLTDAQRVFALVAFDLADPIDLRAADREIARQLFGDVDRVDPTARAVVVAVFGARSGKSWLAALFVLYRAATADLSQLASGELAYGAIVAPDQKLARHDLRFALEAVRGCPALAPWLVATTADNFTLRRPDGRVVVIEVFPASRGGSALRGRWYFCSVLDEAAFFLDADYVVNDAAIFEAVAPRMLPGATILLVSTPWAKLGLLYQLFSDNHGVPTTATAAHAPTTLMRGNDPDLMAIVARERKRSPRNAAQEYDAIFPENAGSLIPTSDVEACTARGVEERPYSVACAYAMTVDVGLRADATSILIFHVENRRRENAPPLAVLVVDFCNVLRPSAIGRVSLDDVERAITSAAKRYSVASLVCDLHYVDALRPRLALRGIRVDETTVTNASKQRWAEQLASRFASRAVSLLDHPVLIKETKEARIVRGAGGTAKIGAPGKKHDDVFFTLLLAAAVAHDLRPSGGDLVCDLSARFDEGGVEVTRVWFERRADGSLARVPAPRGTPDYEEARRERNMRGEYTPEDLEEEQEALRSMNAPIDHG